MGWKLLTSTLVQEDPCHKNNVESAHEAQEKTITLKVGDLGKIYSPYGKQSGGKNLFLFVQRAVGTNQNLSRHFVLVMFEYFSGRGGAFLVPTFMRMFAA